MFCTKKKKKPGIISVDMVHKYNTKPRHSSNVAQDLPLTTFEMANE